MLRAPATSWNPDTHSSPHELRVSPTSPPLLMGCLCWEWLHSLPVTGSDAGAVLAPSLFILLHSLSVLALSFLLCLFLPCPFFYPCTQPSSGLMLSHLDHGPKPSPHLLPPASLHYYSSSVQAQKVSFPPRVDSAPSLITALSWALGSRVQAGVQNP